MAHIESYGLVDQDELEAKGLGGSKTHLQRVILSNFHQPRISG
jgi:hypothetical protein